MLSEIPAYLIHRVCSKRDVPCSTHISQRCDNILKNGKANSVLMHILLTAQWILELLSEHSYDFAENLVSISLSRFSVC